MSSQLLGSTAIPLTNVQKPPSEFLTDAQLAEMLGVTTRTTLRWRRDGGGPAFVRIGPRRLGYLRNDVMAWMAANRYPHLAAETSAKAA